MQVTAKYNDIQLYDHSLLLDFLAGRPKKGEKKKHAFHRVETRAELDALLDDDAFAMPDVCRLIELVMPRDDAPVRTSCTALPPLLCYPDG